MFTGLVSHTGVVRRARARGAGVTLEIESHPVARRLAAGDSVAVDGTCLTATAAGRRRFSVEAIPETVARTTIGRLERGDRVNLELPARLSDRLGGHLVQGHVDGVARVVRSEDDDGARRVWMSTDDHVARYLVPKGSVALDGVSLTVVEAGRSTFQVALVPHTLDNTTLQRLAVGDEVNVEVDPIAKYVERFVQAYRNEGREGARWG